MQVHRTCNQSYYLLTTVGMCMQLVKLSELIMILVPALSHQFSSQGYRH